MLMNFQTMKRTFLEMVQSQRTNLLMTVKLRYLYLVMKQKESNCHPIFLEKPGIKHMTFCITKQKKLMYTMAGR